jgi:hypothetical protein
VALEMEDDLPRTVTAGLYPVERSGELSFAWSHPLATITLGAFDRAAESTCVVVARGARPGGVPQPEAVIGVDGVTAATAALTNEFTAIEVTVPARAARGLSLSISAAPLYVPGPGDPRQLGLQLDRIECTPSRRALLPERNALATIAITGAMFGLLFAGLSTSVWMLAVGCVLFGAATAVALTTGPAVHVAGYLDWWVPLALWVVTPLVLLILWRGAGLPAAGRFVLGTTAAILFVQLIALLHPSKDVVDAVFHARRLGWVLDGRYYFTQPMPGGVQFPYAVGLYASAAPFASLVRDHVALLRIVVCVAEAIAGFCVYLTLARLWKNPVTAAAAAVLYHLAPLPYVVIGNANLTFAFGQSIATIAACMALLLNDHRARAMTLAALFLVTSLAYLSHVAVFPLLGVMLVALGGFLWSTRSPALARKGTWIAAIAVVSAVLSVGIYYAHFPEVWGTLGRVSGTQPQADVPAEPPLPALSLADRAGRALHLGWRAFGLPLLALAVVGLVVMSRGPRDQVTIGVAAWGIAMAVFVLFRTVAPVDPRLQRYADEFIERIYYLTLPAVAILAARGFEWAWAGGTAARICGVLLAGGAGWLALEAWYSWIR